jgi:catalase-peroxidase
LLQLLEDAMNVEAKCPVGAGKIDDHAVLFEMTNRLWWPHQLNLSVLHQNPPAGDPMGADFDYAAAFKALDLAAVKADIVGLMTTSRSW